MVERALQHLVGQPEDELIPLEKWRLGELVGASDRLLHHEHFQVGREEIAGRFDPGEARTCIFLPCHRIKPYSQTPVVKAVREMIERNGRARSVVIVVASVPGVVPIGMDRFYPFAYYNWSPADEDGRLIRSYAEALRERVGSFIDAFRGRFSRYIAYFRPAAVEIDSIQGAFAERSLSCLQVPNVARMQDVVRKNRALWRFQGLKREECLAELGDALNAEEA
jgi:predicted RNA-binding protein